MADHEHDILRRMAAGDQEAMMQFYDQYFGVVAGFCRKLISDREAADEVIQDTFWQVWRTAGLYDAGRAPVIGWILTIARSRAIDRLRKIARQPDAAALDEAVGLSPTAVGTVEGAVLQHEQEESLYEALNGLPEAQRTMIYAVYLRGQTAEEASMRQKIPLGTAKTRLRLGLDKLRRMMEVSTDEP